MADEEVLFDEVYELCEVIGKWVHYTQRFENCVKIYYRYCSIEINEKKYINFLYISSRHTK